jgi:ADP-ribose pyrophosphatase
MHNYKRINHKVVSRNPWWRYCRDEIELPTGKPGEYHYVLTNGSAMIIPIADDGKMILIRQYRYLGDRDSIEFPSGGVKDGSSHEKTAESELIEETGFQPGSLKLVGSFNPCNGLVEEICRVYIARNLRYIGARPEETESFELLRLTIEELEKLIQDGTIWDGMTIAAWMLAKPNLH